MTSSTVELKAKGNEAFKNKRYYEAVDYYSQAIELSEFDAILYTNRYFILILIF